MKKLLKNRVKKYRLKAGLSQTEVAKRTNIAAPNLSAIENSKRVAWPLARWKLAKALKVNEDILFPYIKQGGNDGE